MNPALIFAVLACCVLACAVQAADTSEIKPMTLYSKTLRQEMKYNIYLPKGYSLSFDRFPVIYFLHGLGGSQDDWLRNGGRKLLDQLIDAGLVLPLAVVMPELPDGMAVNAHDNSVRYEDYFLKDVIATVESNWRVGARSGWGRGEGRHLRALSGVSTGGASALALAFRHPQMFCAVSAHAPFLPGVPPEKFVKPLNTPAFLAPMQKLFGSPTNLAVWEFYNPLALATSMQGVETIDIYLDCGKDDRYGFAKGAIDLDRLLKGRGSKPIFSLPAGDHNWEFFRQRLPESLKFHAFTFRKLAPKQTGAEEASGAGRVAPVPTLPPLPAGRR